MVPPEDTALARKKPAQPKHKTTAWVAYHPLEREAVRALNLCRKMGKRLTYQANILERQEATAQLEEGSLGLFSKDWSEQLKVYWSTLEGLLREHRKYQEQQMGGMSLNLSPEEESGELVKMASQLSDDEFRAALALRKEAK